MSVTTLRSEGKKITVLYQSGAKWSAHRQRLKKGSQTDPPARSSLHDASHVWTEFFPASTRHMIAVELEA